MINLGDSSDFGGAKSDGRHSRTETPRSSSPPFQRYANEGRLSPSRNHPTRKQVVLPTVKRDYEKNGIPKDGTPYDIAMTGYVRGGSQPPVSGDGKLNNKEAYDLGATGGREMSALVSSLTNKLTVNEGSKFETKQTDVGNNMDTTNNNCSEGGYSTSQTPSLDPSQESLPTISTSNESVQGTIPSEGSGGGDQGSSSSSSDEEEEEKAPFELMGEFLEAVMDEDFETADKLCTMILLYEPGNTECKQFQPLIEEMLKREREAELFASEDDEESSDEDDDLESSSDDDNEEDTDEDQDDDDDDENSKESSGESSSEVEEEAEGQR